MFDSFLQIFRPCEQCGWKMQAARRTYGKVFIVCQHQFDKLEQLQTVDDVSGENPLVNHLDEIRFEVKQI